ncbi:uncharacterized protein LOC134222091 [Armigeres subalbatus]|uniref:uncharacterized protein LOC134222091 n=1 Tax=Armigeres subalbatus TaxID=124917 RepID=UPI002ED3F3D7
MSLVCSSCANEIFHPRCCGIAADAFEEVMKNKQIFWMCYSCTKLMDDLRFRNTTRAAYEVGQVHALNSHSDIMQNLKLEIMDELKTEIKTNFAKLINSSSFTPKSFKPTDIHPRFTKGRRLFRTIDNAEPTPKPSLQVGTGSTPSPSMGIATVPPYQPKFWLYLSRIARDVSTDQVRALAMKRLASDDIQVIRLVAKGRDINTLSFVSFKVGMNLDLKSKALSTSTWPRGVVYREFTDNRSGANLWRPGPAAVCDDPLSTSMDEVILME